MAMEVVINAAGPLPITAEVESPGTEQLMLFVSGSVWCSTPNTPIGFVVLVDGEPLGKVTIFSNGPTTHRSVVPRFMPLSLGKGAHKITLKVASDQTNSDFNDFYHVTLVS